MTEKLNPAFSPALNASFEIPYEGCGFSSTASSLHLPSPTSKVFRVLATSPSFHSCPSCALCGLVPFTNTMGVVFPPAASSVWDTSPVTVPLYRSKPLGWKRVWSLLVPSVALLSLCTRAPLPPPSFPQRILSVKGSGSATSGTLFPPVPIRSVRVWHCPSSLIFTLPSVGWFSTAMAAGTTPARSVGDFSSSYPMLRLCALCSVENPALCRTLGWFPWSWATSVAVCSSVTVTPLWPCVFRQYLPARSPPSGPPPASPRPSSALPAAPCHVRKPCGVYPDTPSDLNSISPAPAPLRSATR